MDEAQVISTLKTVRDGSSFKERIGAFARLPQPVMQAVVDQPGTIDKGAVAVLAFMQG